MYILNTAHIADSAQWRWVESQARWFQPCYHSNRATVHGMRERVLQSSGDEGRHWVRGRRGHSILANIMYGHWVRGLADHSIYT